MVALPPEGGLWCDPSDQHSHDNSFDSDGNPVISDSAVGELDDSHCRTYRLHFFQSEQFNFCGLDDLMGPVVLSVKYYCDSDSTTSNHIRILLRLTSGTTHRLVAALTHSLGKDGLSRDMPGNSPASAVSQSQ